MTNPSPLIASRGQSTDAAQKLHGLDDRPTRLSSSTQLQDMHPPREADLLVDGTCVHSVPASSPREADHNADADCNTKTLSSTRTPSYQQTPPAGVHTSKTLTDTLVVYRTTSTAVRVAQLQRGPPCTAHCHEHWPPDYAQSHSPATMLLHCTRACTALLGLSSAQRPAARI